MKIIYVGNAPVSSKAAGCVHVIKMCQNLAKIGNEVILVVPDEINNNQVTKIDIFDDYGIDKNFTIKKVFQPKYFLLFGNVIVALYVLYLRVKESADIVFGRHLLACTLNAITINPTIYEIHQPITDTGRVSQVVFKMLASQSALIKFVVITNSLKEWYRINYPRLRPKIFVAPDGADLVEDTEKTIRTNKTFTVGYVGHLYDGKGMEIINKLVRNLNDISFEIVGGMENDVIYWKNKLKRFKNVNFTGHLSHKKAVSKMCDYDILLAPLQKHVSIHSGHSNIAEWTSPLKIFEYMATSKPIIASNLPVLSEILKHEYNCLLCPPDDITAWVKAINRLKNNKTLSRRVALQAKKDLVNNYTWESRANKIISKTLKYKKRHYK